MIFNVRFGLAFLLCMALPLASAQPTSLSTSVPQLLQAMQYRERLVASFADMQTRLPLVVIMVAMNAAPEQGASNGGDRAEALNRVRARVPGIAAAVAPLLSDLKLIHALIAELVPEFASHFTLSELARLRAAYGSGANGSAHPDIAALSEKAVEIAERNMLARLIAAIEAELARTK